MNEFLIQLKWQLRLLNKNSIILISLIVTLIYGGILYFIRDLKYIDQMIIAFVLNDPSIIGYFFIALGIYTEMKNDLLKAIFVTPIGIHNLLAAKTLALSIIGTVCSLILAISIKCLNFDITIFLFASWGICVLCILSGLMVLTFAEEFLKFALISVLIFSPFVNIPLLNYLGAINLGPLTYLFPIQGCVDLLDYAIRKTPINLSLAIGATILWMPIFYWGAYSLFNKKIVHR